MNEWTPYNAELQMQSIKVLVKDPVPSKVAGGSFEDTMLLLEMIKEKQQKENKQLKVRQNNRHCLVMSKCLFEIFIINNEYLLCSLNHLLTPQTQPVRTFHLQYFRRRESGRWRWRRKKRYQRIQKIKSLNLPFKYNKYNIYLINIIIELYV